MENLWNAVKFPFVTIAVIDLYSRWQSVWQSVCVDKYMTRVDRNADYMSLVTLCDDLLQVKSLLVIQL